MHYCNNLHRKYENLITGFVLFFFCLIQTEAAKSFNNIPADSLAVIQGILTLTPTVPMCTLALEFPPSGDK